MHIAKYIAALALLGLEFTPGDPVNVAFSDPPAAVEPASNGSAEDRSGAFAKAHGAMLADKLAQLDAETGMYTVQVPRQPDVVPAGSTMTAVPWKLAQLDAEIAAAIGANTGAQV